MSSIVDMSVVLTDFINGFKTVISPAKVFYMAGDVHEPLTSSGILLNGEDLLSDISNRFFTKDNVEVNPENGDLSVERVDANIIAINADITGFNLKIEELENNKSPAVQEVFQ